MSSNLDCLRGTRSNAAPTSSPGSVAASHLLHSSSRPALTPVSPRHRWGCEGTSPLIEPRTSDVSGGRAHQGRRCEARHRTAAPQPVLRHQNSSSFELPPKDVDLRCDGHSMSPRTPRQEPYPCDPAWSGGSSIGKRYRYREIEVEASSRSPVSVRSPSAPACLSWLSRSDCRRRTGRSTPARWERVRALVCERDRAGATIDDD